MGKYLYTLAVAAAWAAILTLLLRGTALAGDPTATGSSPFGMITTGFNKFIDEIKPLLIAVGTAAILGAGLVWHFGDRHGKKVLIAGLITLAVGLLGQPTVAWLETTFGGGTPAGG